MSIILGIDTSSTDLGIGIYRDGAPVASYSRFIGNSHAEHLAPILSTLLSANDISCQSITNIAVTIGPGSFTGLRIGIAFIKGLGVGTNARILPISSLSVLAHAALPFHSTITAAIDARNNDVYTAQFSYSGDFLERCTEDRVMTREEFYTSVTPDTVVVTDTLGYGKSTIFSSLPSCRLWLPVENYPLQRGLLCAAAAHRYINSSDMWLSHTDITPNYLRRSTPEIRLDRKERV